MPTFSVFAVNPRDTILDGHPRGQCNTRDPIPRTHVSVVAETGQEAIAIVLEEIGVHSPVSGSIQHQYTAIPSGDNHENG